MAEGGGSSGSNEAAPRTSPIPSEVFSFASPEHSPQSFASVVSDPLDIAPLDISDERDGVVLEVARAPSQPVRASEDLDLQAGREDLQVSPFSVSQTPRIRTEVSSSSSIAAPTIPNEGVSRNSIAAPKKPINAVFEGFPVAGIEIEVSQRDLQFGKEDDEGEVVWMDAKNGEPAPLKGACCSICTCEFELEERVCALECGHVYHAPCLMAWFGRNATCPLCRKPGLATDKIVANRLARLKACVDAGRWAGVSHLMNELDRFAKNDQLGDDDIKLEMAQTVAMCMENARCLVIVRMASFLLLTLSTTVCPKEYIRRTAFRDWTVRQMQSYLHVESGQRLDFMTQIASNLVGIWWNFCLLEPPDQIDIIGASLAGPLVQIIKKQLRILEAQAQRTEAVNALPHNTNAILNLPYRTELLARCTRALFFCAKGRKAAEAIYNPKPASNRKYYPSGPKEYLQVLTKFLHLVERKNNHFKGADRSVRADAVFIAEVICIVVECAPRPEFHNVWMCVGTEVKVMMFHALTQAHEWLVVDDLEVEDQNQFIMCHGLLKLLVTLTRNAEFCIDFCKLQVRFKPQQKSDVMFWGEDAIFWELLLVCRRKKLLQMEMWLMGAVWNVAVGLAKSHAKNPQPVGQQHQNSFAFLADKYASFATPVLGKLLPEINDMALETRTRFLVALSHVNQRRPSHDVFLSNPEWCNMLEKCTRNDFQPQQARIPAGAALAFLVRRIDVAVACCNFRHESPILDSLIGSETRPRTELAFVLSIPELCHQYWLAKPERVEKLNAVAAKIDDDIKSLPGMIIMDYFGIVLNLSCGDSDHDPDVKNRVSLLSPWISPIVKVLQLDVNTAGFGLFDRAWTACMHLTNDDANAKLLASHLGKLNPIYPLKHQQISKTAWLVLFKIFPFASAKQYEEFTKNVFGQIAKYGRLFKDALLIADIKVMSIMTKCAQTVPFTLVKTGVFSFDNMQPGEGGFWFAFDACQGASEQQRLLDIFFAVIESSPEAAALLLEKTRPAIQRALARWAGTPVTARLATLQELVIKNESKNRSPLEIEDEGRINARLQEALHGSPEKMFACLLDIVSKNIFWWGTMPVLEQRFKSGNYGQEFITVMIRQLRRVFQIS